MLNEEIQNKESENKFIVLTRKPGIFLLTGLTFQHRTLPLHASNVALPT